MGRGNPKYAGTPYANIEVEKPRELKENTTRRDQISDFNEIDFFEVKNNNAPELTTSFPIAEIELEFSCPQSTVDSGWFISIWQHYKDNSEIDESNRKPLKNYDVSPEQCKNKSFSFTIPENESGNDTIQSYYVGVQAGCASFPKLEENRGLLMVIPCDRTDYKLKMGAILKEIPPDINNLKVDELKTAIPLGAIKTGRLAKEEKTTDELGKEITIYPPAQIYSVETYSTIDTLGKNNLPSDVPLLFSCTAAAARQTNDWKLTVYDDKNTVVTGYPRFINGSDCGSTLVDDKGGFKFTLPKDSPRYFVSIQSACDSQSKKTCSVETSQYNIARDVTKIYTGSFSAAKNNITSTNSTFKIARCGLNVNSTISVKVENANLSEMFAIEKNTVKAKKPIKIQIGTMACQILTADSFAPAELMLGSITGNAEIIDASFTAKDSASVTLGECSPSNKPENAPAIKVTLTGTKLDLENLNPTTAAIAAPSNNSVVIPVKVDIGDFHCEGKDAFYIDTDKPKIGDKTYSNNLPADIEISSPAVNLELSKTSKIESTTDVGLYYVDSSINSDTILNFSCDASTRFNNDWKVSVYNSDKTLNGTPYMINGSDCGTGKDGDNGAYKITILKDKGSMRYFVAVKSACEIEDSNCKVDTSTYILSREIESMLTPSVIDTPVPVDPNAFDRNWLTTKKNLGATLQTGQINAVNDTQIYQVDTGTEDANLTFSCNNAVRYQNDWKILIYDSTKNLKSTTMINGSSCGIGQAGDSGAYAIPLTKDSSTYYLIVKSACEIDDKTCAIDKSQYQLKRVTATQAVTNAAAKPCFGTGCTTTKPVVKPFFTSPK
ncbi:MAG: hypothetical protein QX194_06690 [Methylococcales bacterium]